MKKNEIRDAIRTRLDITELRPMQEILLSTDADGVALAAPTGSGKTLAFACYMLRRLSPGTGAVQGVVIVPSRELAMQVRDVLRPLASGMKTVVLYGGHSMEDERNSLIPAPDLVVATPGRLLDHIRRGQIDLSRVATLVIDEYDKSLELGFEDEMRSIVRNMPGVKNVVLTSATPMDEIPSWLGRRSYERLDYSAAPESRGVDVVEVESPVRDKISTLRDLLHAVSPGRAIVFVNHRESAERVYSLLRESGIDVALYHGGLDQHDRETALTLLANGSARVLVSTDLASRGLDIDGVDAVVHYHMPSSGEAWIHRNGRTARNGGSGEVYVITAEGETIPDYVEMSRRWNPPVCDGGELRADMATLHINAGRKEKVSRGDVVGYLIANAGLTAPEIGKITSSDHETLVAVPRQKAREVVKAVAPFKLKNKRVRVTQVKL